MSYSSTLQNAPDTSSTTTTAESSRKYRVLLVDDHPITRQGVCAVLAGTPNFEVCGEAGDAETALQLIASTEPDLAVVDVSLRARNGIQLTQDLKQRAPQVQVLVMSMFEETAYAERALRAGASGYLMKHEAGDKLATALQQLLQGAFFVSPRVQARMLRRLVPKRRPDTVFPFDTLSEREREVFALVGEGYSTRQIGARLGLSSKTIDSYREHLKLKLGLDSGAALVRHAIEWGRI